MKEDKDADVTMTNSSSELFHSQSPDLRDHDESNDQRKDYTSPNLQLDETSTPWRVTMQENNVAIVDMYTVQPNEATPTTPVLEGNSPDDNNNDEDRLDRCSIRFTGSNHVNKSPKKRRRKASIKVQQAITSPASNTCLH